MKETRINRFCSVIDKLYEIEDWSSIIVYSRKPIYKNFERQIESFQNFDLLATSLNTLVRIGMAYYYLENLNNAKSKFEVANKIFKKINIKIQEINQFAEVLDSIPDKIRMKFEKFDELKSEIDELKIVYKNFESTNKQQLINVGLYIAFIDLKRSSYLNCLRHLNSIKLNRNRINMIQLRMTVSEAVYEMTKKVTGIVGFISYAIILVLLFNFFHLFFYNAFTCVVFSVVIGYLFYIFKVVEKFLSIFSRFLTLNIHDKSIKVIEKLGKKKDFDTYFAICKLYYYLGQYSNATFYAQSAKVMCVDQEKYLGLIYSYLARIAYKTGNHSMAIFFYDKTIENLLEEKQIISKINDQIHAIPNLSDMIKYSQQNRDFIERKVFCRTYLPLIITLIVTIIISLVQIFSELESDLAKQYLYNFKNSLKQYPISNLSKNTDRIYKNNH